MSILADIIVPLEQEGTKAVVRAWLRQVGDTVSINDALVELETDKVAVEVPTHVAGVLAEILLQAGDEAVPGAVLGRVSIGAVAPTIPVSAAEVDVPVSVLPPPQEGSTQVLALSPSVRRAVREHGVDPATVVGSGRGGRITRADIDRAVALRTEPAAPAVARPGPIPAPTGPIRSYDVPHDRMRLAIAENMLQSVTIAPHVTAVFEADFSAIMAHRKAHKAAFERAGVKLTFSAYLMVASAQAMKAAPSINSRWHPDRLEVFEDINIGVGTALGDKGLVVPVVQNVQNLSLEGVAARLQDQTERARANKLTPADMRGGTFTISNHGVSGSLLATPIIIAQPQSAILGVGKLEKRVVVREVGGVDAIQIRPMCYVSLTIDHRVVDGHQTNAWLTRFVDILEGWSL